MPVPTINVLAGVNGAGKSSIGEQNFNTEGAPIFNPDTVARKIRQLHPDIPSHLANAQAWQIGKSLLEQAIAEKCDYRFETTLGGNTITSLLMEAARSGHRLQVWFCGLESAELHIRRVRARVAAGGHDIPEEKIRERWTRSRENLIRLLPFIHHLRVFDNSAEADPAHGIGPSLKRVLEMKQSKIVAPDDLTRAPEWAHPIMAAAIRLDRQQTKL
jgi:predicted ABC-type ATPase